MKEIFTILAVLFISLSLRAADDEDPLEIDQNNGDDKVISRPGCFYSSLQEFSHVTGNSLLYLGAGGGVVSAFLNYAAEKYAKPFIIGSLACFAGGVLFKTIEQTVKNMQRIDKLAQEDLDTYPKSSVKTTEEQQPGSATATAQILDEDVESAIKPPISVVSILVETAPIRTDDCTIPSEDPLAEHKHNLPSTEGTPVPDNDKDPEDNDSDTSDDWDAAKVTISLVPKGADYSLTNAMQYIGRVTTPYLSWLYGKQNTN